MPEHAVTAESEAEPAEARGWEAPQRFQAGPAAYLLALQRSAGNRAVGRLLAGRARRQSLARAPAGPRPEVALDTIPLDVRISLSPTSFEISEWHVDEVGHREDELYWAKFNIVNGNMQVSVQTVRNTPEGTELRSPNIRYGATVAQALTWFESQGQPVKAWPTEWSYMRPGEISTNLRVYYAGLDEGMTPEQAARNTPTGRVATALGFGEVTVLPHTWESDVEINPDDESVPRGLRQQFPKQRAVFFPSGVPPASGPVGPPPAPRLPFVDLVPPANVKRASPLPNLDLVPPANVKRASPSINVDPLPPANPLAGSKPPGVTVGPGAVSGLRSDLAAGARSGAVAGGVALFGVLTSIGRQYFDRWFSERQLQDLEPEIERRLNEMLPNGIALRATDPLKPVYANIVIRTSQPSTFEAETGGGARRYDLPVVRLHSVGFSHEALARTRRWQEWHSTFRVDRSETVSSVPLDDRRPGRTAGLRAVNRLVAPPRDRHPSSPNRDPAPGG